MSGLLFSSPYFSRKCCDQRRDVVLPLAQRRQVDVDDVQPVVEVLAEAALVHHLLEVAVGGRDDARVDADRLHAAEPHELALLHHAQQLGLRLVRDVADLVEEDAALVGEVVEALLRVDGAGERPLDVAEQRGLEQIRRQVARIDGDEGAIGAWRVGVDGARHQLLAGAAFAGDENRRAARRRLHDQVEHLAHARAAADDAGELLRLRLQALAQRGVLGHQLPPLHGVAHHDHHLVVLERLGDVVEGAALHRRDRRLDRREGRHHHDRQVLVDLLQLLERRDAVDARHHHVHDRGIERRRARGSSPSSPLDASLTR